ncbi:MULTISPECIES: hypothetical protein [Tsukamurella]|uniref:hypothetical protein n=1 Tax=Tsukamurella TaxID=2060 RepID=UPI002DD430C9|nr:hypothetical protein [Tsukamurella tyrosinosolvens]MEC4614941.1 hypothetical protein [Tsukamurella tyrosinosolvens]
MDAAKVYRLERVLTVCVGVDYGGGLNEAPSLSHGGRLSGRRLAELGYSDRRAGGIVLLDVGPGGAYVLTVDVPSYGAAYSSLPVESTAAELIAEIIGHSLPLWPTGYATSAAMAKWDPLVGQAVSIDVPPRAECAYSVRQQLREVVADVSAGRYRVAADEVNSLIEGLCAAGNTLWDVALREDVQPAWPWVRPYVPPALSIEERSPELEEVASRQYLFEALAWLFVEPHVPRALCRSLAAAYGTQETIAPVVVDLAVLSVDHQAATLRAALQIGLIEARLPDTWMRAAVAENLVATEPRAASSTEWVWSTSPDPPRFPVLRSGSLVGFHVPRQLPDGFVPNTLHVLRGSDDGIVILALDARNRVAVVPALPQDPVSAACCLTAIALGLPSVDEVANIGGVCGAPEELVRVLSSVAEVAHTVVEWSAVQQLVGQRPGEMSDIQLHRLVSRDSEWPLGQP